MEHQDKNDYFRVVDPDRVDYDDFIPEDLAPLIESVLPYKSVIPVKDDSGDITFYSGRVRMFCEKDRSVKCFIVDKLEML